MKKNQLLFLAILSAAILSACAAAKTENGPLLPKNFHTVNAEIYRSGQPREEEMADMHKSGKIKSVLNLREYHSDKDEVGELPLKLYEIPLAAGSITEADLVTILKTVKQAPKPILIHCYHGSDRTGAAVAACRIVFENWDVERAVSELMEDQYGHHKLIYRNIPKLLRNADWKKIREDVKK